MNSKKTFLLALCCVGVVSSVYAGDFAHAPHEFYREIIRNPIQSVWEFISYSAPIVMRAGANGWDLTNQGIHQAVDYAPQGVEALRASAQTFAEAATEVRKEREKKAEVFWGSVVRETSQRANSAAQAASTSVQRASQRANSAAQDFGNSAAQAANSAVFVAMPVAQGVVQFVRETPAAQAALTTMAGGAMGYPLVGATIGIVNGCTNSIAPSIKDSDEKFEKSIKELERKYKDKPVPRPPYWNGYRLVPDVIEFWQGRDSRLHDRLRYKIQSGGKWLIERLAP